MDTFPLSVQTTYQDLLEAHLTRDVSEIAGTPVLRQAQGRGYWYAQQRIAGRVIDKYIGPNTPEIRARLEKASASSEDRSAFNRRCSTMVAQLRVAGLPTLDRDTGKVLNAVAQVGTFRLGGTLIGTHAFRLYSAELGLRLPPQLGITSDVDIAAFENLKLAIDDSVDPSLAQTFRHLKLRPAPGLDLKHRPTRWVASGGGTMVDFLTPKMLEDRETVLLEPLGVFAHALPFLNFLIADPLPAVGLYRSGVLLQIPRPERFAIHKLIVASRRHETSSAKAAKDLAQAEILIGALAEDRPYELSDAFERAYNTGPAWKAALDASLKRRPQIRDALSKI